MSRPVYFIALVFVLAMPMQLEAQDSTNRGQRNQLQQLTAQLQQSQDDESLRKKIITLAA